MKMDSCKAGNNSDQIFENEGIRKRCLWIREEEKAGRGKKRKGNHHHNLLLLQGILVDNIK